MAYCFLFEREFIARQEAFTQIHLGFYLMIVYLTGLADIACLKIPTRFNSSRQCSLVL